MSSDKTSLSALGSFSFHLNRLGTFSSRKFASIFAKKVSSSNLKSGANQGDVLSNITSHLSFLEQYGSTIRN